MKSKLSKYYTILSSINGWQTFWLYCRVKKPRSASIRVMNRSCISLAKTGAIQMNEGASLEINHQDYQIDKGKICRLSIADKARLHICGNVSLLKDTTIYCHPNSLLSIGRNTYLNGSSIDCSFEIAIGSDCAIADGVRIMDNSWHSLNSQKKGGGKNRKQSLDCHQCAHLTRSKHWRWCNSGGWCSSYQRCSC